MQVRARSPVPELRPFVRRFLLVEFPAPHRDTHLPDTGPVAAFSLRGECRIDGGSVAPAAAFTGLHQTLRSHEHSGGHAVLLATFTPVGAAALLRCPSLEEFAGTTADLADILGRPADLDRLHDQLADAPPADHGRRVGLLEDFLRARLRLLRDAAPDPLIAAAVAWLERNAGAGRVGDLAGYIGLSQSALERRFRRVVGVPPKRFASVVRLRNAVRLHGRAAAPGATGGDDGGLTGLARAAGYYDQAHFTREFRRATGSAPGAFFRREAAD